MIFYTKSSKSKKMITTRMSSAKVNDFFSAACCRIVYFAVLTCRSGLRNLHFLMVRRGDCLSTYALFTDY